MFWDGIWQSVGKIITAYSLLKCKECAIAIMCWLEDRGISGAILRLKNLRGDYILSRQYGAESITTNDKHYF